jgi:serine/threonine protein kinase
VELERRLKYLPQLGKMITTLGRKAIGNSLAEFGLLNISCFTKALESVLDAPLALPYGLIHGDLRSQNVLVDDEEGLHLIDFAWAGFGWRALDFLMLECSLKFLVAPNDSDLHALMQMEKIVDERLDPNEPFESLDEFVCGSELRIIAAGVAEIRRQALSLGAATDIEQYRRGLIAMSATLCGFPQLHRSFLIHSLAFHAQRC